MMATALAATHHTDQIAAMSDQPDTLLSITGLKVTFAGVQALRGIDLEIKRGEALGVVGESGSGKTLTWLTSLGLMRRSREIDMTVAGTVRLGAEDLLTAPPARLNQIRGKRIAMVFQDASGAFNPMRSLGWQITEVLGQHRGLKGAAAQAELRRLLDMVGLPDPARIAAAYPHEVSGGQNQRAMIAMALAGEPDLLIADEPTTALDATIQAQILELLRSIQRETGMAMVLISHDLAVVSGICDRVVVMYAGQIVEQATASALFANPSHPYTQGLLGALPDMAGPRVRLVQIRGQVPHDDEMPPGCAFAPRCESLIAACSRPQTLRQIADDHRVACIRAGGGA